jgi:hypothetical protein
MSGPQGSDPTQPWAGQQPADPAWQQPQTPEQAPTEQPAWGQQPPAYGQQPPAYGGQPYQQPQYGQPGQYDPNQQYGQQPTAYSPSSNPQYGQPPGQYGQQPPYSQPGQYDPNQQYGQQPGQYDPNQQFSPYSSTGGPGGSKKSTHAVLGVVGAFVVIVLIVVGVLGFWTPGWFVTTNLDVKAAQTGVQQILSDQTNGYGAKNVEGVNCNNGANPKVVKGGTFDCEVSVDGTKRQVTVTFQDDSGTYEVGRPR